MLVLIVLSVMFMTSFPSTAIVSGDFEYEVISEDEKTMKITKYIGTENELEIPTSINGYTVTIIDEYAFSFCKSLATVTIPNTVTKIEDGAFRYCESLKTITIPNSVTSIDRLAFSNCGKLTSIEIPDSVLSIGDTVFADCSSLKTIKLSAKISRIEMWMFLRCTSLESVSIPNGVTSISGCAFYDCTSLTGVTIPNSVTLINASAFAGCELLEDVYYLGSKSEWENTDIKMDNTFLLNAKIHFHYGQGHVFGKWEMIKDSEMEVRSCLFCDKTETREITTVTQTTNKMEEAATFVCEGSSEENYTEYKEVLLFDGNNNEGNKKTEQTIREKELNSKTYIETIEDDSSIENINENGVKDIEQKEQNDIKCLRYIVIALLAIVFVVISIMIIYKKRHE